jgi:hypothetical protein
MAIARIFRRNVGVHTSEDDYAVIIASKYNIPLSIIMKAVKCKACFTDL